MSTDRRARAATWGLATATVIGAVALAVPQPPAAAPNGPRFEHVHALALGAEGRSLWLGTHTGLFRSEDGGRSWKPVPLSTGHAHPDLMAIVPDAKEPSVLFVATHEAGVLRTTDGGATWTRVNAGLGGPDVHGLAGDPGVSGKLYAAVRGEGEGVYRTTDGGGSWKRVDDGPGSEVKALALVNLPTGKGGIWLYAGTTEGLQRSPDCF